MRNLKFKEYSLMWSFRDDYLLLLCTQRERLLSQSLENIDQTLNVGIVCFGYFKLPPEQMKFNFIPLLA